MDRWRAARQLLAMAAVAACVPNAGPVRPEPGVGRPVDPASVGEARPARAPADTTPVRVVPPLPEEPVAPERREPPVRLPRSRGTQPADPAAVQLPGALGSQPGDGPVIRVLIGTTAGAVPFSSDVAWEVVRAGSPSPVATGVPGREWRVERSGVQLRVVRGDGAATAYSRGVLVLRPVRGAGRLTYGAGGYRGTLAYHATDSGVMVVNALPLEDYLAGVVPREIGSSRTIGEMAAVEAQAVAARSYAAIRLRRPGPFDVRATTADQVYGGAGAETAIATRAVRNTRGLVLRYGGRIVNAPYHSTCGGSTAAAEEVWRTRGEPYLQRVSDRIPGTSRDYCDPSPRHRWTKVLDAPTLDAAVARHLAAFHPVPRGGPGAVRTVAVTAQTPSGRAATTVIETTGGSYTVRGNDIRYILRRPGGEILNSTYFSVMGPADARGGVRLEGRGYGHGIGMCQWGAIGRARAGQDFRTILQAYFPGTTVGPAS